MNIVTGCSGIDAIAYAATLIDIELIGQIEIDEACNKILELRYPGVKRLKNIFDVRGDEFGTVDIFAAGIPCQGFSVAGKRKGDKDDRYLWPEAIRIIRTMHPTYVIIENVLGITSMEQSDSEIIMETEADVCKESEMVLETIRKDLEAAGYQSVTIIIPACSVGAPHQRYRVFIVARRNENNSFGRNRSISGQEELRHINTLEMGETQERVRLSQSKKQNGRQEMDKYLYAPICDECARGGRGRSYQFEQVGQPDIKPEDCSTLHKLSQSYDRTQCTETKRSEAMECGNLYTGPEKVARVIREGRRCDCCIQQSKGPSETLGDSEGTRNRGLSIQPRESRQADIDIDRASENGIMADAGSKRLEGCKATRNIKEGWQERNKQFAGCDNVETIRTVESGICRNASRISNGLHRFGGHEDSSGIFTAFEEIFTTVLEQIKWPAGYGAEQHDYEPPRVATGVKNRASRLKALGNAIVWQQILPILLAIKLIESEVIS